MHGCLEVKNGADYHFSRPVGMVVSKQKDPSSTTDSARVQLGKGRPDSAAIRDWPCKIVPGGAIF